jgi:DNA-binding Lrp family transcriptional regulator
MIDVEGGKEDLFEQIIQKLKELKDKHFFKKIQILYLTKCYTHSDISFMVDVKDPEVLPTFITKVILPLDGVWDIKIIPLLNPNFFQIPEVFTKRDFNHFTVMLDVKPTQTEDVYNYIRKIAATEDYAITFLAYTFSSYESDIIFTLLSPDVAHAGKFIKEKVRTIDGVIDSLLWEIENWESLITDDEWVDYINLFLDKNKMELDLERWEMDGFVVGC